MEIPRRWQIMDSAFKRVSGSNEIWRHPTGFSSNQRVRRTRVVSPIVRYHFILGLASKQILTLLQIITA
jgi:hypothetical protein